MDKKYLYELKIGENNYQILKPTRKLREASEDYHLKEYSRLITLGVLPLAAFQQKVNGGSKVTTDEKRVQIGTIISGIQETSYDLNKLKAIPTEELTELNNKAIFELESKLAMLEQDFQSFQTIESQAFDNTAEGVSKNKLLTWLVAFLSYKNDEEIFKGTTLDEKLDFAENIEDEELAAGITRLKVLIMAWNNGRCSKFEEFKKIDEEVVELLSKSVLSMETGEELVDIEAINILSSPLIEQNAPEIVVSNETSQDAATPVES